MLAGAAQAPLCTISPQEIFLITKQALVGLAVAVAEVFLLLAEPQTEVVAVAGV
jgi:hypothetical protein